MRKASEIIKSENELIERYNQVCDTHLKKGSLLKDLSDEELLIWIAGKTYAYGRSWDKALENAEAHLDNRGKAERQFSYKREDLGAC